jgi:hypothetical protein
LVAVFGQEKIQFFCKMLSLQFGLKHNLFSNLNPCKNSNKSLILHTENGNKKSGFYNSILPKIKKTKK